MKKFLITLLTLIISVSCVFCMTGCTEVENGSKIQRIKMVLEVYDAAGNVTETTDVYAKLYLNFAPKSTAHIIDLIEDGYYNGTCISNINSNWLELGAYEYGTEGIVKKAYDGKAIEGEFEKNGWTGNTLTIRQGAIVFKREYDGGNESKYNTATNALAICLSSSASSNFNAKSYCILGMIVSDDADDDADTDLGKKSSIGKLSSLTEYKDMTDDDDNTVVTYYDEVNGKYYTKWTESSDNGSDVHYAEGATVDEAHELTGAAKEDFIDRLSEEANSFLVVPAVKLVIKTVTLSK